MIEIAAMGVSFISMLSMLIITWIDKKKYDEMNLRIVVVEMNFHKLRLEALKSKSYYDSDVSFLLEGIQP